MDESNLSPEQKLARERARKGLMNIEAQEIFDDLINKNPRELSAEQADFITARRGYMNDQQLHVFQSTIDAVLARNANKDGEQEVVTDTVLDDKGVYVAKKNR